MKTQLLRTSILALVVAAGAYAQTAQRFQANIPFDFAAGSQNLPAGHYTLDPGTAPGTVIIKSADNNAVAMVMANAIRSVGSQKDATLVFHRYGNQYFLAEVWGASDSGYQLPKTSLERELARRSVPDSATVLAKR